MKPSDKYRQLAQQYYDKAKSKGVKFRNKDLRRLQQTCNVGSFNGLLDLYYSIDAKINDKGELVFSNPIADTISSKLDIFKLLKEDSDFVNNYYQPVKLGFKYE